MKVIIADDESLVRSSLISMLGELDIPLEVTGEARNGEELVRLVTDNPPDLAFVDIRMPKLNGLDAIARLNEQAPGTQWIILTGFSDFDYVKSALRLGAVNYLLKPVSPEQLAEALSEAGVRSRRRYESENRRFEHLLLSLIHGTRTENTLPDFPAAGGMSGYAFMATVFPPVSPDGQVQERERFAKALSSAFSSLPLCRDVRFAAAVLPGGEWGHFLAWDPRPQSGGESIRAAYQQVLEEALSAAFGGSGPSVPALQTGACDSLPELIAQLDTLHRLSPIRTAVQLGRIAKLSELRQAERSGKLLPLGEQVERLYAPFLEKDFLQYAKEHKQLKEIFAPDLFREQGTAQAVTAFLRRAIGFAPGKDALNDREAWFAELLDHGERTLTRRAGEDRLQVDWVEQVIRYVDRNYMNEIGIGQIAAELNVTPNYLSSLFHKKKGITFVKYLTEIRMLKAKELLLVSPSMKVRTIADEVGYHSVRHFTKTFTDYFGCYPSELRDKHK